MYEVRKMISSDLFVGELSSSETNEINIFEKYEKQFYNAIQEVVTID